MVALVVSAHGGTAVYRQIAAVLRGRIKQGEYPGGHTLPAEQDLATEFGVGRDSIRDALAALRGEGLIETRRGFRSRVREQPDRTRIELPKGTTVTARMPTPEERVERDVCEGVPMLIVQRAETAGEPGGGESSAGEEAYPADRFELHVD